MIGWLLVIASTIISLLALLILYAVAMARPVSPNREPTKRDLKRAKRKHAQADALTEQAKAEQAAAFQQRVEQARERDRRYAAGELES